MKFNENQCKSGGSQTAGQDPRSWSSLFQRFGVNLAPQAEFLN